MCPSNTSCRECVAHSSSELSHSAFWAPHFNLILISLQRVNAGILRATSKTIFLFTVILPQKEDGHIPAQAEAVPSICYALALVLPGTMWDVRSRLSIRERHVCSCPRQLCPGFVVPLHRTHRSEWWICLRLLLVTSVPFTMVWTDVLRSLWAAFTIDIFPFFATHIFSYIVSSSPPQQY